MNRRGVGMIVAWIFIFVAGGTILLLFAVMAADQIALSKSKLEGQALQQVAAILTTQQATTGTAATVPIPPNKIHLTCRSVPLPEGGGVLLSQLTIGGHERPLEHHLVAGRDLEADRLVLFTEELRLPYALGNILYVSAPDELLVVSDETGEAGELNKSLPPEIRRTFTDGVIASEDIRGFQNVRNVFITSDPLNAQAGNLPVERAANTVNMVVLGSDWTRKGKVIYFDAEGAKTGEERYYGMPMLIALLWQGDVERAECFTAKVGSRLAEQTRLQQRRLELLAGDVAPEGEIYHVCYQVYNPAVLDPLRSAGERLVEGNDVDLGPFVEGAIATNEAIIRRGVTCATIY